MGTFGFLDLIEKESGRHVGNMGIGFGPLVKEGFVINFPEQSWKIDSFPDMYTAIVSKTTTKKKESGE